MAAPAPQEAAVRASRIAPHLAAALQAYFRVVGAHTWLGPNKTPSFRDMIAAFPDLAGLNEGQLATQYHKYVSNSILEHQAALALAAATSDMIDNPVETGAQDLIWPILSARRRHQTGYGVPAISLPRVVLK